jgi:hypothetical protein
VDVFTLKHLRISFANVENEVLLVSCCSVQRQSDQFSKRLRLANKDR